MTLLLFDFIFKEGEFYDSSFILDVIANLIGAFLGIWGAYQLYKHQTRNERRDILQYAAPMVDHAISSTKDYGDNCLKYSHKNIADTTGVPLLPISASRDVERLVQHMNHQNFYNSYISEFGSSKQAREESRNIFRYLDYIAANMQQIPDFLEKELLSIAEKKKMFIQHIDKAEELMVQVLADPDAPEEIATFFNDKIIHWTQLKKDRKLNENLPLAMQEFGDPIISLLTQPTYRVVAILREITFSFRRAGVQYDTIKQQAISLQADFSEYGTQLSEVAEKLKIASNRLVNQFANQN